MLRVLVLALVVLNVGYFAWTRGAFAVFGVVPARFTDTEPQRLANQLRPTLLQIRVEETPAALSPASAASAPENAASAATVR